MIGGAGRGDGLGQIRKAQDLKREEEEDENGETFEFLQGRHANLLRVISQPQVFGYPCTGREAVNQN